ncbi:MAG: AAA family ATPase, partial [Pseudomonadota bacterium]
MFGSAGRQVGWAMASDDIHEQLSADRAVAEPFLGREDLLTEFDQFMARATERKGGIFLLAGEPGSGKSRSIEEFAVRAENAGALVLSGSCPEHSSFGPFRPWVQILAHLSESATSPEQVRLFGNKQNLVHGLLNQPVTPPVSTDSSGIELMGQRFELFQTISSAFVQLADHSPLLLTLDDLHAADPSSLALLLHLAGFLRRHAILLIISYRDTEVPRKSAVAGALADLTRQGARRYRITGLGESNSYALTEALIGEPLPERWRRELYRQTSGNPLFITEIARAILQARAEGDGTLLVVGIPLGIQEAIGQQLDKFSR